MRRKTKIKQKSNKQFSYKELANKYRLLSYFMSHIPDVIYFKDKEGRLILVNQAHARGLGLKPEEVVGKTDFDFFPKERAKRMAEDDIYVMETGKSIIDKVERATRADGVDNYVSTTKIPMYDDQGKVTGLVGITRDITRRIQLERLKKEKTRIEKKLEVLEELNKVRSEFISAVSHELRTPLSIIKQLVMLIFDETGGPINDKQREMLKRTRDNIERLNKLISGLLDVSRIEGGQFRLHYSLVNLNDLLKGSADFFEKVAKEKGISLSYHLPKRPINLFIDADRVNQILSNLLDNAIKFTEQGGRIEVEVKVFETKIRIGLIDTGIGIAKSDLSQIFDKFTQVSKTVGASKKGVGLGLSIAKELVKRHGGEIWAESQLGVGSKIYFTLLRFYTPHILNKPIKDRIEKFLKKGISVQFINLLIITYKDFKERVKIGVKSLFKDFEDIIDLTFKEVCGPKIKRPPVVLTDTRNGKCSIIFPGGSEEEAAKICRLLKDKIKSYFIKNKIENTFVALGILSYPQKIRFRTTKRFPASLYIKEVYVGSEMRRFKRVPYKANIKIPLSQGKTEIAQTVDISAGGLCFIGKRLLTTDSEIKIRLEFPNEEPIFTKARVAWIRKMEREPGETTDKYKVGLEFTKLKNKYREVLFRKLKL